MKPILFNTEMVKAILSGRKSVTRRVVKPQPTNPRPNNIGWLGWDDGHGYKMRQPYRPDDILYVRERWRVQCAKRFDTEVRIEYMAGGPMTTIKFPRREDFDAFVDKWADNKWHPSIHMPKEAARLFLRVTDVRVERLQDITESQAEKEGCSAGRMVITEGPWGIEDDPDECDAIDDFSTLWDSTIKKAGLPRYDWKANPFVWCVSFERISKEEAME